jgi:hypothetical protein
MLEIILLLQLLIYYIKLIIASDATTKHFKCSKPGELKEEKCIHNITKVARLLPFKISETALSDE